MPLRHPLLARFRRHLAVLLLAAGLHALALPVLAAPAEPDCEHCAHLTDVDPCLMTAGAPATADAPAALARGEPPLPGARRPVAVLPAPEPAVAAAARGACARALRPGGRGSGDPPRHLAVGRLLI
jgi:hypothetical protein